MVIKVGRGTPFRWFRKGKIVLDVVMTDTPNIPSQCVYSYCLTLPSSRFHFDSCPGVTLLEFLARIALLLYAEVDDALSDQ